MCHPEFKSLEECKNTLENNYTPKEESLEEEDDNTEEVLNARIEESGPDSEPERE